MGFLSKAAGTDVCLRIFKYAPVRGMLNMHSTHSGPFNMRELSQFNLWLSLLVDTQVFRAVPHVPDDDRDHMIVTRLVFFLPTSIAQPVNKINVTELKRAHIWKAVNLETSGDVTCTEKQKKKAVLTETAKCAQIMDLCKQMQMMRTVAKMQKHQRGVSTEKMLCPPHMLYVVNVICTVVLKGGVEQQKRKHNSKPQNKI